MGVIFVFSVCIHVCIFGGDEIECYLSIQGMYGYISKVIRCTRNEDGARLNVMLNGEALEEVDQFKYLGSVIAAIGGVEADVRHRVNEGCKMLGAL